jgi:hypothetical protein
MIRLNRATTGTFGRCFLAVISVFALARSLSAAPMVYTGIVVTDVRVGSSLMHNASLKITFEGDTDDIIQVVAPGTQSPIPSDECFGPGYFLYLVKGHARMEIESRGRTRTARLKDDQIFVAVDECHGGIGFGSFVGPNGLEVAYPFALTLGTAEYASITYATPLLSALSTTGSAWSCIGYPPGGDDALPATDTGNCIPPDSYPLKSDIGDIFIYQPYFEYDGTSTAIISNHSGSTNRGVFLVRPKATGTLQTPRTPSAPERTHGSRVVYTLQTVADGSIGGHAFYQALVTFQMTSDTASVRSRPSPVDATRPLYENRAGHATVTVDDNGDVITADLAPREVYVRYDTGAGVAGFGSQISPTYPVALNCSDSAYPSDNNYTADCFQGDLWSFLNTGNGDFVFRVGVLAQLNSPGSPSEGVAALPQSLSRNTLLTGTAHTCAGVYTIGSGNMDPNAYFPGNLGVCGGPARRGLHTSKGDLFLLDLVGGTNSLSGLGASNDSGADGGWDLGNSGFLHVEVSRHVEDSRHED